MSNSEREPDEPIDRLIAAIDRLTAAVLATGTPKPGATIGEIKDAYLGTLDCVLNESRDLKDAFAKWTKPHS